MDWLSKPSLEELLTRERPLLDEIFGEGAYEVEGHSPHEGTVRSNMLEYRLGYDRDGSVGGVLIARIDAALEADSIVEVWVRFLGEEIPRTPRNSSGQVTVRPEEQLRRELQWLARLSREVFSDSQKARDAAHFVLGYQKAYGEWASGAWDSEQ